MNVGRCRYCGAVEDFDALMRRQERKSAAAKERWQNPEYQAKLGAIRKKQWQDPEYQAKMRTARARRHK
ncbi:hypothetical protein ES703_118308 [subsurface metagenome]